MYEWDWVTYFLFCGVLFFAFICLRQYDCFKEKGNPLYIILGLLPSFVLFAFRHQDVGWDLKNYAKGLMTAKYGLKYFFFSSFTDNFFSEPLSMLIKFASFHLGGINAFIIITSTVQFMLIYVFLVRLHKKGFNVTIIFLLFFAVIQLRSVCIVRNGLAIVASFCAYTCLFGDSKEKKWYWFFSALAFGFHNSAIINVPIYFVSSPILGNRWDLYRNVFFKSLAFLGLIVLLFLVKNGYLNMFFSLIAAGKYANYDVHDSFGLGNLLIRLPILGISIFFYKGLKEKFGHRITCIFYMVVLDLIISQLKYFCTDFERFTQYTVFGEIMVVALLYDYLREKVNFPFQFVYFFVVMIYFTVYLYRWAIIDQYGLMPFKFMEW